MNPRLFRLLAAFLVVAILGGGALRVAGQQQPPEEWVVFMERGPQGFATQGASIASARGTEVVNAIPAFDAYVVRANAANANALRRQPGVRAVVPNIRFSVGPPPRVRALGDTTSLLSAMTSSVTRVTPNADFGRIVFGQQATFDLRVTNVGFAPLGDGSLSLEVVSVPAAAGLTTGSPGAGEYRIEWQNPETAAWEPLAAGTIVLPESFSVLVAGQRHIPLRVTLGDTGSQGTYTLGHTIDTIDVGGLNRASIAPVPWHVTQVRADLVWPHSYGESIKVAVVDTGIDPEGAGLTVTGGCNAVNVSGCQPVGWEDDHFHGTAVAGILAAKRDDSSGLLNGVAPEALLYSVKVLGDDGNGTLEDLFEGLAWAGTNGMQVVNLSLGIPLDPNNQAHVPTINAICEAFDSMTGMVVIAATGNEGGAVNYPAACPSVIAAGAVDANDELWPFSNRGVPLAERGLLAPGHEIFHLAPLGFAGINSGTSFASPIVAGAAALLLAGGRDPADVYNILAESAKDLGMPAEHQGAGLLDVYAAWAASAPGP